ncbi:hypothetical protein [Actinomadura geliboluensis]|uniref:hypothetical protein n=1 Tax=Actinomadura geliboluensis TaxID=882440 RepID=UPI0036AFC614
MRRNAALAVATALACAAGTVAAAAPAHAAGWTDAATGATAYNGSLDRVDFGAGGAGWAVGAAGNLFGPEAKIVRWTGSGWSAQQSPVGFTPVDVAVSGPSKAWVIGYNLGGTVGLYWNGTAWSQVSYPLVGFPNAVSAAPDGAAYSIAGLNQFNGGPSAVLRWTGSAWVDPQVPLPPSSSITAVDVRAADDVWLAGTTAESGTSATGLVMHFDGTSWERIDVPGSLGALGFQGTLYRIVADSPTNVHVLRVRQNAQITNAIQHYDGTSWTTVDLPLNATGAGMSSDGQGGVVVLPVTTGTKTRYLHYDGSSWTTLEGPARTGTVQASDADARPGTAAVVSTGTATEPTKKAPFIEQFG